MDNSTTIHQDELSNLNEISNQESLEDIDKESYTIYIGKNITSNGGEGSLENPYESLELACNNILNVDKVTIKVFEGTYYLNSDLKFNTSNLNIIGQGNVVIKNLNNNPGSYASIGLSSSQSNFTFSNLTFDATDSKYLSSTAGNKPHFYAFNGGANLGIFNNCTFTGFNDALMINTNFNKIFNYCNFINSTSKYCFFLSIGKNSLTKFNYCNILSSYDYFASNIQFGANISFNNVWFGLNEIPGYVYPPYGHVTQGYSYVRDYAIPVNKYAIFQTYEKYLGDNTFEIIGELKWNDGTCEGIDNLGSKLVKLSSNTGTILNFTILENGTFKTVYLSNSHSNEIIVELDGYEYLIIFENGIQVIAEPIYCGDEQNITVSLSQNSNGWVNISVNNKTYELKLNDSSLLNFQVPEKLLSGIYLVQVNLTDNLNHYYGSLNVNWNISKINQKLIISTPADARIDDEKIEIIINMPKDATGNISILANNKNLTRMVYGGDMLIDVSSLLTDGDNDILINYSGNNRYSSQVNYENVHVDKIFPNMQVRYPSQVKVNDDSVNLTIRLSEGAYGNITVFCNNKNLTLKTNGGQNLVNIDSLLNSGANSIRIIYSGNELYENQIKNINLNVEKLDTSMHINISKTTFELGENIKFSVSLSNNISGYLIICIDSKNYTIQLKEGNSLFEINNLTVGSHILQVKYAGNDYYTSICRNLSVSVKEVTKPTNTKITNVKVIKKAVIKITAKKKTFKAKKKVKKFTITLKSGKKPVKKVWVTLKIKGKKLLKAKTNSKGKATFKIKKLTKKGKYNTVIKFKGNKNYKASSKKVKITIKKIIK